MDGLSATSSYIAILSLAVQLINATQNLRAFFTDVAGAPGEIRRLATALSQLADILQDVQMVSKIQEAQIGAPPAPRSLLASLDACKDELFQLQVYVNAAEQKTRGSGKISRHWESFMIVVKKKEIEKYGSQLDQATQFLSIAMTMNLMVLKYVHLAVHVLIYLCLRK